MKSKYNNYTVFTSEEEVKNFLKKYYDSFMNQIPDYEAELILMTHGAQLSYNHYCFDEIREAFCRLSANLPKTPFDLVLFRGDDSNNYRNKNRPFLAHTFLEDTAKIFTTKNKLYKIYVPKNSIIFPTCAISKPGAFSEQEVLLETSNLKRLTKHSFRYNNN